MTKTASKTNKGGNGNTPSNKKSSKQEAVVASPPITEVQNKNPDNFTQSDVVPKKIIDSKIALETGLTMAVNSYMGVLQQVEDANKTRNQARGILVRLGLEVPNDGADDVKVPVVAEKKTGPGRPAKNKVAATASVPSSSSKSLWALVQTYLYDNGFIAPNFTSGSTVNEMAIKAGYSTAANLLSLKSKEGELTKGERGQYALPKNYKPS
jgi:hypothetical protein